MTPSQPIAVVILNWNGANMLHDFLPSVVRHSMPHGRVIVADNGSTDDSRRVVETEFPQVQWLQLERNFGFAEGYNRALAQIDADYYVLLNSDVEVAQGWIDELLRFMQTHPQAAACQPKLLSWKRREEFEYAGGAGGFLDWLGYPFCRGRVLSTLEQDHGQYDTPCRVFWATGAALMVRRSDWEAAGGLDGDFFAHMEEIDLCWRLRAMGREVWCVPSAVAYHVGGATLGPENPRKTYLNFRNNLLMLYKNLPAQRLRPVMRWRGLLDAVAAVQFALSGGWGNAKAVARAHRDFKRMRPAYEAKRKHVQARAVVANMPECMPHSLLVAYYLKGKKTFAQLAKGWLG